MKKFIAIILSLVFVFAFTACLDLNGEETTVADGTTAEQEGTTTEQEGTTVAGETTAASSADENETTGEAVDGKETTASSGETKAPAEKTTVSEAQSGGSKAYAAFSSGNFYMACTVDAEDGTESPIVFASKGEDIRMDVTIKGSKIGIIVSGGRMFMIYQNSYAELSESILTYFGASSVDELISSMGITEGFASDMFAGLEYNKSESATYAGKAVTKYYYTKGASGQTILYETADGQLLCMENLDASGNTTQTMVFTDFRTEAPADAFSVSGYTESDIYELMMNMYTVIEEETLA